MGDVIVLPVIRIESEGLREQEARRAAAEVPKEPALPPKLRKQRRSLLSEEARD